MDASSLFHYRIGKIAGDEFYTNLRTIHEHFRKWYLWVRFPVIITRGEKLCLDILYRINRS